MKFKNFLNEADTPRNIIMDIYNDYKYDYLGNYIEKICQKINPRVHSFADMKDSDFAKIKTELEKEIKDIIKSSIYKWLDGDEIPEKLDITFTKKEFKDSLKTLNGKKIPVDSDGMPHEDVRDYGRIMDFYRKYVK